MSKRFSATEIWDEDWFLDMPNEYKLFWYYMLSNCDHAGLFKVNLRSFCSLLNVQISDSKALSFFNEGKDRVRVLSKSMWFIEDFFVFQYGHTINPNNKVHESIIKIYNKYNINTIQLRGVLEVKERSKRPKEEVKEGLKDKDKDKDIVLETPDLKKIVIAPEMVKRFKQAYPYYPINEIDDFTACLSIAYKIAKEKGWSKESVLNGKMNEALTAWDKIIEFSIGDKWYATRSISDFNKEFQRIVQSMAQSKKTVPAFKQINKSDSAPLSYLKQDNDGI